MKHGPISSLYRNEEKKQINLWRGGDFKERIKPLIVRSEFRWNSSRWLERISEKLWVRVKSRFHLQQAVVVQPYAVKKINRSTDQPIVPLRGPLSPLPSPFLPVQGSAIGCLSSLEPRFRSLGSRRAKIIYLPWRKSQPLRNATCY